MLYRLQKQSTYKADWKPSVVAGSVYNKVFFFFAMRSAPQKSIISCGFGRLNFRRLPCYVYNIAAYQWRWWWKCICDNVAIFVLVLGGVPKIFCRLLWGRRFLVIYKKFGLRQLRNQLKFLYYTFYFNLLKKLPE